MSALTTEEAVAVRPVVGVIGLGSMGGGVARSLLREGFSTRVCDVRPGVLADFAALGALPCSTPAQVAAGSQVLIVLVVATHLSRDSNVAVFRGRRR